MKGNTELVALDTGLTVALERMPGLQSASFALLLPRGSAWDPVGKCGLTAILEEILLRGAGGLDARELTEAMDALGLDRGVDSSSEVLFLSGSLLGRDLDKALNFIRDIVLTPRLAEEDLAPSIDLTLQAIMGIEDVPSEKLFVELGQRYLPWPYGRPNKGIIEEVKTVGVGDLREAVAAFTPRGSILAIAGDIDHREILERIKKIFGKFNAAHEYPALAPKPPMTGPSHIVKESGAQVQIGMALPLVPMAHEDYSKAVLLSTVLSGGMSGRLFVEVREKRGLVYAVRASYGTMKDRGDLFLYAGTTPERARETIAVMQNELERLREGVTEEELSRARVQFRSSVVMSQESSRSRAKTMATDFHKLGRVREPRDIVAAINAVSLDAMNAFLARTEFKPMTLTLGPTWE